MYSFHVSLAGRYTHYDSPPSTSEGEPSTIVREGQIMCRAFWNSSSSVSFKASKMTASAGSILNSVLRALAHVPWDSSMFLGRVFQDDSRLQQLVRNGSVASRQGRESGHFLSSLAPYNFRLFTNACQHVEGSHSMPSHTLAYHAQCCDPALHQRDEGD